MPSKWMQKARTRMEKRGTVGSLRAIAEREGLLEGEHDKLTADDLAKLEAAARKTGNTALLKKVLYAKNAISGGK